MRIDLPRPHSPLLPCLNPRKLEVSGREMGSSFSYCGYMFEIHVGTFLKNFEFFGQPRTSLRTKGSLAGVRFGHVPPNRSAEIREPDPLVSPRSWQLTNSPLTSINIGIISHDMFIKAFGSLTVPVSIVLVQTIIFGNAEESRVGRVKAWSLSHYHHHGWKLLLHPRGTEETCSHHVPLWNEQQRNWNCNRDQNLDN